VSIGGFQQRHHASVCTGLKRPSITSSEWGFRGGSCSAFAADLIFRYWHFSDIPPAPKEEEAHGGEDLKIDNAGERREKRGCPSNEERCPSTAETSMRSAIAFSTIAPGGAYDRRAAPRTIGPRLGGKHYWKVTEEAGNCPRDVPSARNAEAPVTWTLQGSATT
jgi:hypothetical protein